MNILTGLPITHASMLLLIQWAHLIIPIIALVMSCFVFILLPQRQQAVREQALRKQFIIGTRVRTMYGIEGVIIASSENFIIIELDDGSKKEIIAQSIISISQLNGPSCRKP